MHLFVKICQNSLADDMALVDLGSDTHTWEKEYKSVEKFHSHLVGILNERDQQPRNSQAFSKFSFQLRQQLNQLHTDIQSLEAHLERLSQSGQLTVREKERRDLLVEELLNKHRHIQESLNISSELSKNHLLPAPRVSFVNTSPGLSTMEDQASHRDMRQIQAQVLEEQDQGLEALSKIIGRQKQMAQTIGEEVESQNDLIDNIADGVDRTRDRMSQQTARIGLVDKKDKTFGYWVVICVLLLAIVIVAVIPKNKS